MKRVMVALFFLVGGCGYAGSITTPRSELTTYPHEVEYQLLGRVNSNACVPFDSLDSFADTSKDRWNGKYRYVYELAKFQALSENKDADVLLYIHTKELIKNGQLCVELTGRAAKVTTVKAVVGPGQASETRSFLGFPSGH